MYQHEAEEVALPLILVRGEDSLAKGVLGPHGPSICGDKKMAKKTQIRAGGVEGFFRRARETARKLDNKEPIASERIISVEDADELSDGSLEQTCQRTQWRGCP